MTIRMLQAWNGLHQQKIVTTLSGSDEAALVAAGIATYDLDGPAENLRMAQLATDAGNNQLIPLPGGGNERLKNTVSTKGTLICDWAAGTLSLVSANAGEGFALDPSVTLDGYQAVKCTFSNVASGTYIAKNVLPTPIWVANLQTLQIPIRFSSNNSASGIGQGSNKFQVWLQTASSKNIRFLVEIDLHRPNAWTCVSFNKDATSAALIFGGGATSLTDFVNETITEVRVVQVTNANSPNTTVWIGPIRQGVRGRGRVTIVMDGEYISQYTYLRPLLNQYGLRASLALVTGNIGYDATYMTEAQVAEMRGDGHECIHHTFSRTKTGGYGNATDWPAASDISADAQSQWSYFRSKGWTEGIGYGVWGYTYGYTSANSDARQSMVTSGLIAGGIKAMRKSVPRDVLQTSGNWPSAVDPLVIDGAIQITSTNTPSDVQAVIDKAEANGEWAIITVHRAVLDSATPGSLEMKNGDHNTWMAYLAGRIRLGGVDNVTFSEGCKLYGIGPAT